MSRYLSAVQRALPMPINTAMFACAGTFTWVCPPGVYRVQAIVAGAGGGGGAFTTNNYGGGGGGATTGCSVLLRGWVSERSGS